MITKIEVDPETGEGIIPLDPEILKQLNWREGDRLELVENEDGTYILRKHDWRYYAQ